MEQITLNFDASEFEGFESLQEFFSYATRSVRDPDGRVVKQCVQAMQMDYSPSQWSQKINRLNNTAVSLDDADRHSELFGDVRWVYFAIQKHIINKKRNRDDLLRLRAEIDRQLAQGA